MSFLPVRVLIIEAQPFKRLVATRVFQDLGCDHVMAVEDSCAALDLLKGTGPVDIVLCSLKLQSTEGLTAIEGLSRSGLVRSVIICSAYPADLQSAMDRMLSMHGVKVLGYVDTLARTSEIGPMVARIFEIETGRDNDISAPVSDSWASKAEVEQAIGNGEFKAFFQPKFNLIGSFVVGVELLARWDHPVYGVLSPNEFLPLVSSCELMDMLFFEMFEQGLALLRGVHSTGLELNVAFNLQAQQLSNPSLVVSISDLLERYGLHASSLTFEITESGLLEASPIVLESLIRLRMMGAGLSIDDFGVGFSSMERLCQLPFTEIKLDASFIREYETNASSRAVVASTLALGHALNMTVVVEGVETESQRQQLLKLGCVQSQGYLFARPMSAIQFLPWLSARQVSIHNA